MNRREIFSVLAGIPILGLLFNRPEAKAMNLVQQFDDGTETVTKLKPGEPAIFTGNGNPIPYLHIPQENNMMLAIPLTNNFECTIWDDLKRDKDGSSYCPSIRSIVIQDNKVIKDELIKND